VLPEEGTAEGEAVLKSIVVPLDGSELAESVLPMVAGLAKKLNLAVVLVGAYNLSYAFMWAKMATRRSISTS
jgi:hypothetical protein